MATLPAVETTEAFASQHGEAAKSAAVGAWQAEQGPASYHLTSGMESFSLISTGVCAIVKPTAMMLLFFSIAYPADSQDTLGDQQA